MPGWVSTGVDNYTRRLPRHLELHFREIPSAQRSANTAADKTRESEAELLLKAVPRSAHLIALDERGTEFTSRQLAEQLEGWLANYSDVAFLVGGADGLADRCRQKADRVWSLSKLTLPHALVRVVLAEQIYRAWTLVQGHPYHRE